jgi:DNA-binding response OmpR family regulator
VTDEAKKILVVDDEQVTTELAKTFLEKNDFVVVTAGDGEEALRLAEQERPDLIMLDVMLPTIDGFEVCRRLRSDKSFESVPILIFTARGFSSDLEKGQEVGADEYILKPFSNRALVATIRRHLGIGK